MNRGCNLRSVPASSEYMNSRIGILFLCLLSIFIAAPSRGADEGRQYYELRVYITKSAEQQKRVIDYWKNAGVPAYNRLGIQSIGVFTELEDSPTNKIYVLLPSDSFEAFAKIPDQLLMDKAYQRAALDFINAPKTNAAYERFETSLLVAFDGMKRMTLPPADKRPNVFELRNYISASENVGRNKIKMFESGEISVMKEVGLAPIFYSRMLSGSTMPSLVYMTCGENMDEHKKHWQAFSSAKVWKDLQAEPQYKDNVSTIVKILLKRTEASQI